MSVETLNRQTAGATNQVEIGLNGKTPQCLMATLYHQEGPFIENWPSHHYCELIYIAVLVDDKKYNLTAGRILLIKPNSPHATRVKDKDYVKGICMHFIPHSLYPDVERIDVDVLFSCVHNASSRIVDILQWSVQENREMRKGAQQVADSLLNILLLECIRLTEKHGSRRVNGNVDCSDSVKRISSACSEYVNSHFHEPLTLTRVAYAICVSPFYLSHAFSEYTGTTFTAYLNDVRMHHASTLLGDADLSIKQIAYETGYNDVYYFSKVFKKSFGIPPGEFRKHITHG